MLAEFHFVRPEWLLGLVPLAGLLWLVKKPAGSANAWARVCDPHLLRHLTASRGGNSSRLPLAVLGAAWAIAVVALANPVWDKRELPVLESREARVLVLDLSRAMLADDLKPTRLARARFEMEDVLDRVDEGQTGLVVFAGDAFVAAPLTSDTNTIRSLMAALDPGIMPVQGNRADLGLFAARGLLKQAGAADGDILLISGGVTDDRLTKAARKLAAEGYRTSVLAVTVDAGEDPYADALRAVASAGNGQFAPISAGSRDVETLLARERRALDVETASTERESEIWLERGPWLTLLLLPLAAFAFRRGWLLVVPLVLAGGMVPERAAIASTWDDLWTRQDQQAAQALEAGELERARELAVDPVTRGTAAYRAGDYQAAADAFGAGAGADADYNLGNALAHEGKLEDAIGAYDRALQVSPDMEDAAFNKALLERLLQQQEQTQRDEQSKSQQQSGGQGNQDRQQAQASGDRRDQESGQDQQNGQSENNRDPQKAVSAEHQPDEEAGGDRAQQQSEASNGGAESGIEQDVAEPALQGQGDSGLPEDGDRQSFADGADASRDVDDMDMPQPRNEGATREEEKARQNDRASAPERAEESEEPRARTTADELGTEELQAAEQWLRRIPDDPGALLRRKFLYQYSQRATAARAGLSRAW